ncbi:aldolase catalytic domain-containing protein [Lachnospiraceae bacterium 62-35]
MHSINILDCTLRDGAYVVDTAFGENGIKKIIESLNIAGIDIIECGFLKNKCGEPGSTVFRTPSDLLPYLKQYNSKSKYVLMFDAGKYDVSQLEENKNIIWGIRDCFHKEFIEQALKDAATIKQKGYRVFIQPTGILNYTDKELLDLIERTNQIGAFSFAIVDTFGSMNKRELLRLVNLIGHNLEKDICLSFHSHNNLQMAYALSQDFIELCHNQRDIIVDSTVYGMGRGAGNTNTECLTEFLNNFYNRDYNTNSLLDLIESSILQIFANHPWGYSIRNFVAGINGCHVDNISYLYDKGTIPSKDVKTILESIPKKFKAHFNADIIENATVSYYENAINDTADITSLKESFKGKDVLLICPGKTIKDYQKINQFIKSFNGNSISINFIPDHISVGYIFCGNLNRYKNISYNTNLKIISTSNIHDDRPDFIVNFMSLISRGHKFYDNSMIMCLKLMDILEVDNIYLAGFDGYSSREVNYFDSEIERCNIMRDTELLNYEIGQMFLEFKINMKKKRKINFITMSKFEGV